MGPQSSDPNNPILPSSQPDLSSVLGSNPPINQNTTPPPPQGIGSLPVEPNTMITPSMGSIPDPTPQPIPQPQPTLPIQPEPSPVTTESVLPAPKSVIPEQPVFGSTPTEPLDGGASNDLNTGFSWSNLTPTQPNPIQPTETAPTDLSQLTGLNPPDPQSVYTPPISQPETLVVPPSIPDSTTMQAESSGHSIPKWLWIAGAVLLIIVIGASAYFILGIGQTPKPASIPANQQPIVVTPPAPSPVTQAPPSQTPVASSSAGFNSGGSGEQTQTATSAADILRQKLQAK